MNLKTYKQKGVIIMTDFDLCMQALEQKGIDYKVLPFEGEIFRVKADTYGEPTNFFFYWKNGQEFKKDCSNFHWQA